MPDALELRAERILATVLDMPPADRATAVGRACGGDPALRARVDALLGAFAAADEAAIGATVAPDVTVGPADAPADAFARIGERPGDVIGRYKLQEQIGEGGFGVVFLADQQRPVRRQVALKVIKLGMDTREVVIRFEAERQALALMDHPNIAKVLDAGATETGRPYFVMELVRGSPITDYADSHRLSTRDRVALAALVCRAVQHAHGKGVIHRDIKPNNVLVTTADDRPVPKVIDFGIAKATQAKLTDQTMFTAHRQLIGTPQYMSPEQADSDGADIDTRTDVYSLGVLIYELLVGTTPLDARSLRSAAFDAMRRMISEQDPPRPSTRLNGLGQTLATVATNRRTDAKRLGQALQGELDWIVMRAMERDRTRRYDTAAALADDLDRFLAGDPVQAGPPGVEYRLRKLARKHRAAVGVAAAVLLALLMGVAGTTVGLVREAHQRRVADDQRAAAVVEQSIAQAARVQAEQARADAVREATIAQAALAQAEQSRGLARQARGDADLQTGIAQSARSLGEQARGLAERARGDATRMAGIAQMTRSQAQQALSQAEQARADAEQQALVANRAAARSDARCLIGQRLLPAAFARAVDAWKLGGRWEDGFTLDQIRAAAQQHWQLVARVPVDGADAACFVRVGPGSVLAVAAGLTLATYDADTGRPLAHVVLPSPAIKVLANDALGSVTVARADGVDRFEVRNLSRVASRRLTVPTVAADASSGEVIVVDRDGLSRVLALVNLAETGELSWTAKGTGARDLTPPRQVAISPSGNRVLLKGGASTEPFTLWERGKAGTVRVTHPYLRGTQYRFADDDSVVAWFVADSTGGDANEVNVYSVPPALAGGDHPAPRFQAFASADDTKGAVDVQVWTDPARQESCFAMAGKAGLTLLSAHRLGSPQSDRYAGLLPTDGERPTYLAASFASGLLALRQSHGTAIFRAVPRDNIKLDDYAARACRDGLLAVNRHGASVTLALQPFDATRPARTFTLQWANATGAVPDLLPWAVCANPDGTTVVVIAQASKGFNNTGTGTFGNAHALVYRNADGLASAPPAWRLEHAWDLGVAPTATWDPRYAAVDPAGRVLLYVTANGGARRFSLDDGRSLGALPLAAATALSAGGTLAAGVDPTDGTLNVFDIATGQRLTSVPDQSAVVSVCLSADDQRVLVADGTAMRSYAVPDGKLLATVPTPLRPLAVPAGDPDRLVAFQPDDATSTSGNLVVADSTGHVVVVLARAGSAFSPAWYSPDGRAVAVVLDRWAGDVFRSLSPDQLAVALNGGAAPRGPTGGTPAMPVVQVAAATRPSTGTLDAADADALAPHVGTTVVLRGVIKSMVWGKSKNVAFLDFDCPDGHKLTGFLPPKGVRQFRAKSSDAFLNGLVGQTVEIQGSLVRYVSPSTHEAWLEVVIEDPAQLKVLPVPKVTPGKVPLTKATPPKGSSAKAPAAKTPPADTD